MKKVLIITYYWPPGSSPGVQRFLKFSKYLRDFDWEPYILTVKNGAFPAVDNTLNEDVPEGVHVFRTRTIEPFRAYNLLSRKKGKSVSVGLIDQDKDKALLKRLTLFVRANLFVPDARIGWNIFAYKKALKVLRQNKINAIITTGPPHSTHLIGLKLKEKLNIPWLADLRDPWTNVFYNKIFPRSAKTINRDKGLEDRVVSSADAISVVSQGLKDEFNERAQHIEIIYNGFDESDFAHKLCLAPSDKFTMSYIGNFKPNQNIETIWEAVAELCVEYKRFENDFRLCLTGNIDSKVSADIHKHKIEKVVEIKPFIPHKESVLNMQRSSLLLFIVPDAPNNKLIITGKLFEYIASGTPIVSVGPVDGDAAELLIRISRDPIIDYSNKDEIKKMIIQYYQYWLKNDRFGFKHQVEEIVDYSRFNLTKKLSVLLNKISHEN